MALTPTQLRARIQALKTKRAANAATRKRLRDRFGVLGRWLTSRKAQLARETAPKTKLDWMPGVVHYPGLTGTAWQVSAPPRGVLHTTEGDTDATGTLVGNGDEPHFQVERNGRITQYLPLSVGSKALKHTTSTPTNGAHAFQIEVVGHAAEVVWPTVQVDAVRRVMRFIEDNAGVKREAGASFLNPVRLTESEWLRVEGWVGHVHVPENDHTDPGHINIKELL